VKESRKETRSRAVKFTLLSEFGKINYVCYVSKACVLRIDTFQQADFSDLLLRSSSIDSNARFTRLKFHEDTFSLSAASEFPLQRFRFIAHANMQRGTCFACRLSLPNYRIALLRSRMRESSNRPRFQEEALVALLINISMIDPRCATIYPVIRIPQ